MIHMESAEKKTLQKTFSARCRFCGTGLGDPFLDLGRMPLANSYLKPENLGKEEPAYPLRVFLCPECLLVQLADYNTSEDIFNDEYAYFSSYSDSWLRHAREYTDMALKRFRLNEKSLVVEIASNDGYLLQYFKEKGIPVLGVEPTGNTAAVAVGKGIPTVIKFFGEETALELARTGRYADLLLGNNVLAHVPPLNDFIRGMKILLKPQGVITMEFPHFVRLIEENQFDTIYHEHFSYYTCTAAEKIFAAHGLTLFDAEELKTHGGSLRIYVRHAENADLPVTAAVLSLKQKEAELGYLSPELYRQYSQKVKKTKEGLLAFLARARAEGKRVACYGAPAKGNTLLNYCGLTAKDILFTVDRSPHKQGLYLPGSRIPVYAPEKIREEKPDYLLILPWNLKEEISAQTAFIRQWGGKFVVPIPEIKVW